MNRRSGSSILQVANVLSGPLRHSGALDGDAGMGLLQAPPGTASGQVRAATFDTWPEEIAWICDQIVEVHRTGVAPRWADIAVLTRRNADIAALYGDLTARDVPVEIVGLGGLLHLPEVMDLTATLRLVDDVTANPDLIRLLTGPRWQVGPRDLALLGRRARELARDPRSTAGSPDAAGFDPPGVLDALEQAVADVDPTEVVSLLDALENPGDGAFSDAARQRFAALAAELGYLRRHSDEPVLDLTRRAITSMGLDVELLATPDFARLSRRDQLGAFLDAVAAYVDVDGDASLSGLLAYLQAEIEQGTGLEQAVPSDREAVKLLTVHKAKGLEWEAVFLPALMKGIFPSDRVTDNWVTNPAVLPADLRGDAGSIPQLADTTNAGLTAYKRELVEQQRLAEDRLAYVAATRAKQLLVGTGHTWRVDLSNARTSSDYLRAIIAEAREQDQLLAEAGPPGAQNPLVVEAAPRPWPQPLDPDALARRHDAALAVERARRRFVETGSHDDPDAIPLLLDGEEVVAGWDADLDRLLAEAAESRAGIARIRLPAQLSTTAVLRLREDPEGYAAELGPADAAPAVPCGAVRHPVPPVGRALFRRTPAERGVGTAATRRSRRVERPRRLRQPRRAGAARAVRGVRGRAVRQFGAVRDRGAVHLRGRRPVDPRPHRCRLRASPNARTRGRASWSSTGRRAPARAPTRGSWRSTGWPGPKPSRFRPDRWTRRSTTCDRIGWSGPSGCPIGTSSSRC